MKIITLCHANSPNTVVFVKYCDTFYTQLRGLMFSKALQPNSGVLLVRKSESRINTAVHMLFMNNDITVLWLDKDLRIVDKVLAKQWGLFYMPKKSAQYVVELHKDRFSDFAIGDKLVWIN